MAEKHLQLIRKTGFSTSGAAKSALESAFASGKFNVGEPALAIVNDGSVVLGIQGSSTSGSTFYNAASIDEAVAFLQGQIDELSAGTATYSVVKTTTGLPETVKERYNLQKTVGSDSEFVGDNIDIYKDSSLVSIEYISDDTDVHYQNLKYVYIDASGNTQTTYIDLSEIILEAEFASGVTVTNHVAHGVVDPSSESFLTVGAGGFKVSGVQNAIDSAIDALDANLTGSTTHVTVNVVEANGKITAINVSESDIASANALSGEITARKAQTGINGDIYVANAGANYISGATSLNDADVKLDTQVKANADAIAQIIADSISVSASTETESASFLSVTKSGTVYTVEVSGINQAILDKIATLDYSDTAAANEFVTSVSEADGKITVSRARPTAANVSATPVSSGATTVAITGSTVEEQISSIGKTLKGVVDNAYEGITSGNGAITVSARANNTQSVSLKLNNSGVTPDILSITSDGLTVSDTFDCGTWS